MKRRVVVTGLGAVTPVGTDVPSSWQALLAGKNGIDWITRFDASDYPVRFAAEVKDFNPSLALQPKEVRKLATFVQFAAEAARQAVIDSGIEIDEALQQRFGVAVGSGIGGLTDIQANHSALLKGGPRRVSPFFIPGAIINMAAGQIAMSHRCRGPNISVVSACTTGAHNIGAAARMIQYGDADVMLAGGTEMSTNELGIGGFASMRALSKRNDDPQRASRPWDKDRDGFVLGEGAGVLLLEEYEHACKRNATIYAEIVGFGMSDDAYHMTAPHPEARGIVECMSNALADSHLSVNQVDYINAHGTSTPALDPIEALAIKQVFGQHADKLAVSSTKSMTGHTLGAAGAIEAIISILAIRDNVAPPTINLDNPENECDLNFVAHQAQQMKIDLVLSNSFGFGGTNASLLFKRLSD